VNGVSEHAPPLLFEEAAFFIGQRCRPLIIRERYAHGEIADEYSDEKAQRRFEIAVKAALRTPPKPRKRMTPKRSPKQSGEKKKRR
jgi:hypothetical protein